MQIFESLSDIRDTYLDSKKCLILSVGSQSPKFEFGSSTDPQKMGHRNFVSDPDTSQYYLDVSCIRCCEPLSIFLASNKSYLAHITFHGILASHQCVF